MKIRNATLADIPHIHALGKDQKEFTVAQNTISFWPEKILKKIIQSTTDWILIAEEASEIQGFIILNYNKNFQKAIIENIYVAPHERRKGIAGKMLSKAIEKIKKEGGCYLCTLVEIENHKAKKFYIQQGFAPGKNFQWLDKTFSPEWEINFPIEKTTKSSTISPTNL
jgi:ribosomal protein S18 acetylase RimI-like enzyme